jgi:chromate transporter
MYEQYVVRPETQRVRTNNQNAIRIERETFLTAAGVVRAIPGPAFSISAFVGGTAMQHKHPSQQIMGALIAAIGIFLPSFLVGVFFYPFWENLHRYKIAMRLMTGINAAVVGIMFASFFYLTKDTIAPLQNAPTRDALLFFSIMSATFFLLRMTKIPPPFIALGCLLMGLIESFL